MGIRNFHVIMHDFQVIRIVNNIALAKCRCCQKPRYAVYLALKGSQEFWYHGLSYEEALKTFNFLVKKQSQSYQVK